MPYTTEEDFHQTLYDLCEEFVQTRVDQDAVITDLSDRYQQAFAETLRLTSAIAAAEAADAADCGELRDREEELYAEMLARSTEYESAVRLEAEAEASLDRLLEDKVLLEDHIAYLKARITEIEADIAELEAQRAPDESLPELEELKDTLASLKSDVATHGSELADIAARIPEAETLLEERAREVVETEAALVAAENAYEDNSVQLDLCEERERAAEADVDSLRSDLEAAEAEAASLQRNTGEVWLEETGAAREVSNEAFDRYYEARNQGMPHVEEEGWEMPAMCAVPAGLEY